jgi:AraC family transcriptional activator of pobA
MSIQFFDDINDSHAATGYRGRTDLPDFHAFTVEDTDPDTRRVMPPYHYRNRSPGDAYA